jgi:small subunit ribosomal protein S24
VKHDIKQHLFLFSANLKDENVHGRSAEVTFDDIIVRKFMKGTWPGLLASEVIIKRRQNMVVVAGLVFQELTSRKMYFLVGYSEEMLSYLLKCPVRLEIQTVQEKRDVIFKKV